MLVNTRLLIKRDPATSELSNINKRSPMITFCNECNFVIESIICSQTTLQYYSVLWACTPDVVDLYKYKCFLHC